MWEPAAENEIVVDAVPLERATGLPTSDPSTVKVTVPVGVELPEEGDTFAVRVMVSPTTIVLGE